MKLTYFWVHKTRQEPVRRWVRINCEETVVEWYNLCREVCSEVIENENVKLSGPGKFVEIDESKFGNKCITRAGERKVFGCQAESREHTKYWFLTSVPDRSTETLIGKIKEHVLPGANAGKPIQD